jgi:tripartite-type tricarboxylate transporter receptor subunit TctC
VVNVLRSTLLAFAVAIACSPVAAEDYPSRPITMIIPTVSGVAIDAGVRHVAKKVGDNLGKPIVIENRPGANGAIAAQTARSKPGDGYTLYLGGLPAHTILPAMGNVNYDYFSDFQSVTLFAALPFFFTIHDSLPPRSFQEMIAFSKTRADGLNYGPNNPGSNGHVIGAIVSRDSGAKLTPIYYRDAGQGIVDVSTGRLDVGFLALSSMRNLMNEGKVHPIAVASTSRWPAMPNVPTLAEVGFAHALVEQVYGLAVPMGTPSDIVAKLNREFVAAFQDPAIKERMNELGLTIKAGPAAEMDALIRADSERLGKLVKELEIKLN